MDLHLHTLNSDGALTVKELVNKLYNNSISYAALTDHDCILGVDQFMKLCNEKEIKTIPGVELQAYYDLKNSKYLHMLCYSYKDSKSLNSFLENERLERINAINKALDLLKKDEITINFEDIEKMSCGRHLLINHVCLYLEKNKIMNYAEAYNMFCQESSNRYVEYPKTKTEEMIRYIHDIGGIAVLAHPKRLHFDNIDLDNYINHLKKCGLDGIETYYGFNSIEDIQLSEYLASKYDLLETAGSDWHCEEEKLPIGIDFIPDEKKEKVLRRLFNE